MVAFVKHKGQDFWSVTNVRVRALRKCAHFRTDSMMVVASFSIAGQRCSQALSVLDMQATDLPSCDKMAAMGSQTHRFQQRKGCLCVYPRQVFASFYFSNTIAFIPLPFIGNVSALKSGLALDEKLSIHFASQANMPDTRFSSLGVCGGGISSNGLKRSGSGLIV